MADDKVNKQRNSLLFAFTADYGILFVLLALCLFFSVCTYKMQNPTGGAAGRELANRILAEHTADCTVVILTQNTKELELFATALEGSLKDGGAEVLSVIRGKPPELRKGLEDLASEKKIDVLACNESLLSFSFVENPASRFAHMADTEVMVPSGYMWPTFLTVANLRAVSNRIAVIAIIAIGMTMVIITGGIDLSVGSLIALSACVTTWLIRDATQADDGPPGAALMTVYCLAGILACGMFGLFSGLMVTVFRIKPFIVTLAVMLIGRSLASMVAQNESIYQIPESFGTLGRSLIFGVNYTLILMLALYAIAHVVMNKTVFGRYVYAVGGNEEAARLSGIKVKLVVLSCYVICGLLAGLGGIIRASELISGLPTFGTMAELTVIAAVVVGGTSLSGGRGKIMGTLIGALIIGVIENGMNITNVDSNVQGVVLGSVILSAVLLDQFKYRIWKRMAAS